MEKTVPKQLTNLRNNVLLFRKSQLLIMKRLLLLLVLACFCATTYGQAARTTVVPRVTEVNAFLTSLRSSENAAPSAIVDATRLEHLLKDVQPATYFYSGVVKNYGENPVSLYTNAVSLSNINSSTIERGNIEMVTITINAASELNNFIDLSVFSSFPKLKYIYILSTVETTETVISNLVRNSNPSYGVFYKIDKGA